MKRKRNQRGFTLAELLIVVAIIGVLAGVAFVAVQTHQESLNQVELDAIAKEIFVAAQNHLTMARNEGYIGLIEYSPGITDDKDDDYGKREESSPFNGVYYYSVQNGVATANIFNLMLPPYALDGTALAGNFIVRYQPSSGLVLDVFYASPTGKYARTLDNDNYSEATGLTGDDKKNDRRRAHIGWYGGNEAASLPQAKNLEAPVLEVENGDRLIAKITDKNGPDRTDYKIALLVTGKISQAQQVFRLENAATDLRIDGDKTSGYTVILDDITTANMHFAEIGTANSNAFIPGEDIVLRAVAYNETALSNIANSDEKTVNSLFEKAPFLNESYEDDDSVPGSNSDDGNDEDSGDGGSDEAETTWSPIMPSINSIRHLENLDPAISSVNYLPESASPSVVLLGGTAPKTVKVQAFQTTDLEWKEKDDIFHKDTVIYNATGQPGVAGCFLPVNMPGTYTAGSEKNSIEAPSYISYDGKHHSIKGFKVSVTGTASAGLFGDLPNDSSVKDLALINFNVTSVSGSAGALAGTLTQKDTLPKKKKTKEDIPNVSNAVAYNTTNSAVETITTAGDAGGLIGKVTGEYAVIEKSAAALVVKSTGEGKAAGGLIGSMTGGSVTGCYSGGHTVDKTVTKKVGEKDVSEVIGVIYDSTNYNVTGAGTVGGLIGDAGGATVSYCYSTCSATGNKVAGLVGNTSGAISKCYSTGLVLGTGTNPVSAAFAVMADGATATDCKYYEIINELATVKRGDSAAEVTVQMDKVVTGDTIQSIDYMVPAVKSDGTAVAATVVIYALDASAESYNSFVGAPEEPASGDTPAKILWKAASPYDLTLANYYKVGGASRYNLQTVSKLGATDVVEKTGPTDTTTIEDFVATHYGDWPAPEIFVSNTKSS